MVVEKIYIVAVYSNIAHLKREYDDELPHKASLNISMSLSKDVFPLLFLPTKSVMGLSSIICSSWNAL